VKRLALVGGRGYTGAELLRLLIGHPELELVLASSGSRAGHSLREACPEWPVRDQRFEALEIGEVASVDVDAWVLAVPNGAASAWAAAISGSHPESVIVDLSADHRFSTRWVYGLPERYRDEIAGARHIANPGCYATGMQLGLLPLAGRLDGPPVAFGVSGYSGAGRTPSPRNDPERLADNLQPYALTGHVHEREVSHQLDHPVRFLPHVAQFFRGIGLTIAATLEEPVTHDELNALYEAFYEGEPRVGVVEVTPEVSQVRGTPDARVGGFVVDERDPRCVNLVVALDNLGKGAASQALQNLNLALGLHEHLGLEPPGGSGAVVE
jgi:N-acetyl-gamma-glutamyl-phosphate reductase